MPKDHNNSDGSGSKGKKRAASDDGPEAKKPRSDTTKLAMEHNEEGDPFIAIDKMRRVTVRQFKGKVLVDFREFYTDKASGNAKPGKKGISLSAEQWAALKANMDVVDLMLAEVEK
ncbi:hypothetical protein CspHIS471_0304250 [Cutaneotrichosporon sp. HIS471]|nr:hypothetical protein CspHIS471_0304250 [Cutaneotrichosporon sp. HIS471]